ncbi:MAG: HAMP domain-containing protein [Candidatus Latescibacterota bacterium]
MAPIRILQSVAHRLLDVPIRLKIMGIGVALVLLLGLGVILLVRHSLRATLAEELVERGAAIASDVAGRSAAPLRALDVARLNELVEAAEHGSDDVRYVVIVDRARDVLVHTFAPSLPPGLLEANPVAPGRRTASVQHLETEEGLVFDVAMGLDGTAAAHVGMSAVHLDRSVAAVTRHLLIMTGLAFAVGVVAAYLLTAFLTRPILELASVAAAVGAGDFGRRARVWADDEIGRLGKAFNAMTESLARSTEKLRHAEKVRSQLLEKALNAQEEERGRVARDLHDQTSQSLTSLIVGLKTAHMAGTLEEGRGRIAELRALAVRTLDEVHALSLALRPSVLDDLGLVVALERHAQEFARQHGIAVSFHARGFGNGVRLPPQLETTLYRVSQEALANVARHAGARNTGILLEHHDRRIGLIVEDDGKGFDVDAVMSADWKDKLGLFGMRERMSLVGGTLTVESSPGRGTAVYAVVTTHAEIGVDGHDQTGSS